MGAVKHFLTDAAEAGRCPISPETWDYLDRLEAADPALDWIGYCEHDYTDHNGRRGYEDCITMESARQLIAEGLANDEITLFVECFGDYCMADAARGDR